MNNKILLDNVEYGFFPSSEIKKNLFFYKLLAVSRWKQLNNEEKENLIIKYPFDIPNKHKMINLEKLIQCCIHKGDAAINNEWASYGITQPQKITKECYYCGIPTKDKFIIK